MGNPYELKNHACSDVILANSIVRELHFSEYTEIENEDIRRKDIQYEINEIVKKFKRKGGYIQQLKKYLGLDLDAFCYENYQNSRDRAKILYLIHRLRQIYPNINILKMISIASIENNFSSSRDIYGCNSEYVRYVIREIEKELSLEIKSSIKWHISHALSLYDRLINHTFAYVTNLHKKYPDSVNEEFKELKSVLEIPYPSDWKDYIPVGFPIFDLETPLETLYFILLKYNRLGHVKDTLFTLNTSSRFDYTIPEEYIEQMNAFNQVTLRINKEKQLDITQSGVSAKIPQKVCDSDQLDDFFSSENISRIAKYVYLKDETTADERKKFRNCKDKVRKFLNILLIYDENDNGDILSAITELTIISMLQIICLDESNEILDYTYYGFEGNKNRRKGKIHVQAALKNDNYIPKVLRIYLGCKLSRRIYVNLGEKDVVNHLCEIMTVILKIVEDMLNAPDFFTMFSIASFHLKNLDLLD